MRGLGAIDVQAKFTYASVLEVHVAFPNPFNGDVRASEPVKSTDEGEDMEALTPQRDQFDEWYNARPLPTGKI